MTARRSALAFLTGSSLAQAASYALSAVLASALLGPHGRGLMVLGTTIGSIAGLVTGLGTGSALRAQLPATPDGTPRRRLLAAYTWWSLIAAFAAGTLAALLSAVSAPFIDPGLAEPPFLLAIGIVSAGYAVLTQFPDAWYAAGRFRSGSAWAAGMAAGGLVAIAVAAVVQCDAWTLLLAQGTGMLLVATAQAVRLRVAGLLAVRALGHRELWQLVRFGCRALGLTIGLALALRADRYVLGAVAGATSVGIYSVAATFSEAPRVIPVAVGQLVNREVALGAGLSRVRRAGRLSLLSAAALGLAVAAGGWLLIEPLFGPAFAEARPLLLVLLVAELLFAPFAVASRGLLGGGWLGTAGVLGLTGSAAAITLYGLAVPRWGVYGAAIACVALYAGLSVAAWVLLHQRLRAGSLDVVPRPVTVGEPDADVTVRR